MLGPKLRTQETVILHPEVVPWPYLVLGVSQEKGLQSPAKVLRAPESSPEGAHPSACSLRKDRLPELRAGKLMVRDTHSPVLQSGSISKRPFCSFSLSSSHLPWKDRTREQALPCGNARLMELRSLAQTSSLLLDLRGRLFPG